MVNGLAVLFWAYTIRPYKFYFFSTFVKKNNIITYIEKDKVLAFLCSKNMPEQMATYSLKELLLETDLSFSDLNAILSYFSRNDLISSNSLRKQSPFFQTIVYIEAFDLYQKGGYTTVEEQLTKNLEKLNLELEELRSDFPEKTATLTSIITAITGVIGLWR